jgi:hypothetical protein
MTAQPEVIPGITGGQVTDLEALAAVLGRHLADNRRPGVTAPMAFDASLQKVVEEAGELAGAHSRFRGTSRRLGTIEDLEGELADVVLSAAVYAVQAGAGQGLRSWHRYPLPASPGTFTGDAANAALLSLTLAVYRLAEAHGTLPAPPARASRAGLAGVARLTGELLTAARGYAAQAGVDLDAAVTRKVTRILARGWREEQASP